MCWRHFRGITVVTTFALILVVAYQHPAAADCGDPPGPRDCYGDVDGDGDTDLTDLGILLAHWGCEPLRFAPATWTVTTTWIQPIWA